MSFADEQRSRAAVERQDDGPDPGPGQQLMRLLAREGRLEALLDLLRAEVAFTEKRVLVKLRAGFITDQTTQAEILALQGRLSAFAALLGKWRAWGTPARPAPDRQEIP